MSRVGDLKRRVIPAKSDRALPDHLTPRISSAVLYCTLAPALEQILLNS